MTENDDAPLYPLTSQRRERDKSQRQIFCETLAETGDVALAGERAGYTAESARTISYRREVKAEVQRLCTERLTAALPLALNRLIALLDDSLPTVALNACRAVLDRAGLPATQNLDVRATAARIAPEDGADIERDIATELARIRRGNPELWARAEQAALLEGETDESKG